MNKRCARGLGLLIAYALLGSTWLVIKTEDKLPRRSTVFFGATACLCFVDISPGYYSGVQPEIGLRVYNRTPV